jgi:hypothetical protein
MFNARFWIPKLNFIFRYSRIAGFEAGVNLDGIHRLRIYADNKIVLDDNSWDRVARLVAHHAGMASTWVLFPSPMHLLTITLGNLPQEESNIIRTDIRFGRSNPGISATTICSRISTQDIATLVLDRRCSQPGRSSGHLYHAGQRAQYCRGRD